MTVPSSPARPGKILGIQHIGIAVTDMDRTLPLYRRLFGMDISLFDSIQEAPLMRSHTRGETITKRASMVMNLQGGCAFEVLQPTSFVPRSAPVEWGDLGLLAVTMKTHDVAAMHRHALPIATQARMFCETQVGRTPWGDATFWLQDPDGIWFQVVPDTGNFAALRHPSSGGMGCTIGVSDIDQAMALYGKELGYDEVLWDESGVFSDWAALPRGGERYRRVRLRPRKPAGGGFSPIIGNTTIELVQALDRKPPRIFRDRIWCDTGIAHLGMDVREMGALRTHLTAQGFPFRCDSNDAIGMGKTRVHCTYIDDADETWIELIEVHRVPIVEKWGLFLNVQKRAPEAPMPRWMLHALRFSRIRDAQPWAGH